MNKFKKGQEVVVTKQAQDFIFPVGTHGKVLHVSNIDDTVDYLVSAGGKDSWWYLEGDLEAANATD